MSNNTTKRTMSLLRSNSSISQSLAMTPKGATLASIYQAKKSGKEDTKVEVLKQQFQTQLEQKITTKEPTKILNSSHIPSRHEREVSEFRKLEREKSFDEARTAVQSQIEKIFMKTAANAAAVASAKNAKGKNNAAMMVTTNNARLSRRDQEQDGKTKKHLNNPQFIAASSNNRNRGGPPRGPSMESRNDNKTRSSSMVAPRTPLPDNVSANLPKRHNLNARHNSVDNLTPVKPRIVNTRYPGARRARDLEQHLRDKYGLPSEQPPKNLRRTNSHSNLVQFSPPEPMMVRAPPPPPSAAVMPMHHKTLLRRKSFEPDYGPKSLAPHQQTLTHLHHHHNYEPRDSKLRYLGRMSPEEQVDKYLKSVEKVNAEKEARLRQRLKQRGLSTMHLESHTDYRTTFDPTKHVANSDRRINTSISSRWHSLDSVSRPVLAKNVNNIIKKSRPTAEYDNKKRDRGVNAKPPQAAATTAALPTSQQRQVNQYRERTDLPKSFASMPQIAPMRPAMHRRKSSESSDSPIRKTPEEKMSTGSDNVKSRESTPTVNVTQEQDDYVDSCSCTDVTLDETLKINHNHRKSMARKKKLQAQRLKELQKAEAETSSKLDNNNKGDASVNKAIKANYLGSISLDSRSSDLLSLQKPLKSLYFKYVIAQQAGLDPINGTLEITKTGLKVQYKRNEKYQEVFSTFTSIAVWAAVRFVHKTTATNLNNKSDNNSGHFYAFLPLITDPGDEARNRLFCPLAKSELKYTKRSTLDPQHPPMFACITRKSNKNGEDKELECHGFVCKSTEEAVSVAAQLYQSLIDTMKAQGPTNRKYRLSRASSISMGSVTSFDDLEAFDESPKRPEKNKTVSTSASSSKMSISSGEQHPKQQQSKVHRNSLRRSKRRSLKKKQQKRNVNQWKKSEEESSTYSTDDDTSDTQDSAKLTKDKIVASNGDIYTKVAMPRSKSFMKMNNTALGGGNNNYNLQELFKELKEQHGIASIDDLLRHVIRPEGMSFNGIEPVYRELLLKLAMSMSKDEIFIRSKTIMDEEKDKKKALLLMGGSKLLNNKNFPKDSSGRLIIQKEPSELDEPLKDKSLSKIFNKKAFLMKRKNSTKNKNSGKIKVTVGGKTTSGSISKQFNSSKRRRSNLNLNKSTSSSSAPSPKPTVEKTADMPKNDEKKPLTKFDIGSPMPLVDGARDEVTKKWMLTDIKDIKADLDDLKSGPDSGITSGGQTLKSSTTKGGTEKKSEICSECGYQSDAKTAGLQSICSCSVLGTVTPTSRSVKSRMPPSSACSTCYCQTCGEDSATATCYSCSSMYSDVGGSMLQRKSSIKSISKIGDRTLAIIDTDSDSSLGSFGSIDSPKTAWRNATNKPEMKKNDDDSDSITDSSVASVIEAVNRATDGHSDGHGEVIDGYFRNPATSANGAIYGFTLRRKVGASSPSVTASKPRPSFRQYNATVTSRQSRISVDSLASPLSSLTLIGQNKSGNSNNIDSAMTTLSRNRGPRPAYSDANMQHSLGYLP